MEASRDNMIPVVDVYMTLLRVPVESLSGFSSDIGLLYNGDLVAIGEFNPHTAHHKLINLSVKIGAVDLRGADIKKGSKVHLLPGRVANLDVTITADHHGQAILKLLGMLGSEVPVKITERQLSVVGMEQ